MQIAFLGLGQIGGSIARAASAAGLAARVSAWSPTGAGPGAATAHGIVPAATAADAIRGAGLIVLAAPPLACLGLIDELAGPLAAAIEPDAVITDVASTKAMIVERARSRGLRFVGGHPMAGRETAGYGAADPGLLRGRPWVIVPAVPADPEADARVAALATACGARPVKLPADVHDRAVAAISHLPLVVSVALAESMALEPDWATARELASGGWAGMTRLARGDATMGAGILATNGAATAARLRTFRDAIGGWIELLTDADVDPAAIDSRLRTACDLALDVPELDGAPGSTEPW
ncbi:MAG TPA: prephenate dehydrogenase/arogenate dehydrogenase family protein [Candidatus Acidoferrum sp.]|nr:prephenate dehydrogenase/arogenate dehydrogenase family protein [Candidatus Acidoferrum sp.]